ncbi:ribonuclease Y [Clostridium argentinense CDC 2741]|uniref:Ribonuclease Y n=1 Tax=Clostridium argentinense CDC 2741 TaxID=1418104 RepID=A0A0C1U3C8_9CLOT|nr:ribonuclease Y [Clostridium argentinense]ARC85591.1 ribonuclease Y [Clostridium argentinense]KIE47344.1 ribonuclease Y [Clostridium argentinense CDC 2741]NFF40106.1 ribonuclease Y [Clostridium argentinense]NFP52497.1 ribonuclease Y [Clostridium argentinense]NFP74912.1 ribonuclease Y [Clostridium argentinense]
MDTNMLLGIGIVLIVIFIGIFVVVYTRKNISQANIAKSEEESKKIIEEAKKDAESKKKEAILEAKEEVHRLRTDLEKESRERRNEVQRLERRTIQREESLDKKSAVLEKKEENLNKKQQEVEILESSIQDLYTKQREELERLSDLTSDEAKQILLDEVRKEIKHETAVMIKEVEQKAKEEADKKAREIITYAIQRCAADHVAESTVHVVSLPNDEMKGRIIGREGRNIRALETLTGVDLIIDDTPEAVILSGFDPIRREVARIALEKLIVDGRIHPARIEEMVEKAKKDVDNDIKEEGEQATFETGVHGLHIEILKLLGRLKYRTSYGQNVLKHSVEVAYLAGLMASELGMDPTLAKRCGLLHDIGKAVDHEVEGPHALIGAELAKKYHESPIVVNAIAAHHGDVESQSLEAVLVQAADAISAARPGARRETLEAYIKRLEKLEEIANSYEGVEKSYAIQAGREIRIMIKPEEIDDAGAIEVARDIVKKIESELEYPGQIKVNVIRETRAIEYAK